MLSWANQFNIFCFLDNQHYSAQPQSFECLVAAGVADFVSSKNIKDIDCFLKKNKHWVFGHLSYDVKNSIHHFHSTKKNKTGFPDFFFFVPQILLQLKGNELTIAGKDAEKILKEILEAKIHATESCLPVSMQQNFTKEEYLQKIKHLQQHIIRGDCYEINFCQEFFAENVAINPLSVFQKLMQLSPNPFSAFYRLDNRYLMCASPERFLSKKGIHIFSQPMKGTIKRNTNDADKDEQLKNQLRQSAKDRSENVMVVDMVRNDLTKICRNDSVQVNELFGVYSYPQVHQMISTVSGEINTEIKFSEIIEATFPMASMTGAPKHRVMELIDEYEASARGIFSGSVGYINPEGDFDFNVVIRSIMYNAATKYLSYEVGSGITFYSNPEDEWEECLLKAEAITKVLLQNNEVS